MAIAKDVKPEQFTPSQEESKKLQKIAEKEGKQEASEEKQSIMEEKETTQV